ncbi:unnamed protein product [Urochloa humidicola]
MSQGQPRRPQGEAPQFPDQPITYGDVFDVKGELASRAVAPRDAAVAALLQSAEQTVLGQTQRSGPAAVMQSAAALNARAGHVGKGEITGPAADAGATVTEAEISGRRVVSESVGGQVVANFVAPARVAAAHPAGALGKDAVTVGRALEAVAATAAGDRPVDPTRPPSRPPRCAPRGPTPPSPEASPRQRRLRPTTTLAPGLARTRSSSATSSRCALLHLESYKFTREGPCVATD